jgi:hypothetical protein
MASIESRQECKIVYGLFFEEGIKRVSSTGHLIGGRGIPFDSLFGIEA